MRPEVVAGLALLGLCGCTQTSGGIGKDPLLSMDMAGSPDPGDSDDAGTSPACTATSLCRGTANPGWQCVLTVDVRLVDESGQSVAGQTPTVCGKNLCLYGTSDAQGMAHIPACYYLDSPAYKFVGYGDFASFAAPVPNLSVIREPDTTLTRLPATGADFPKAGQALNVTSGGVSVTITASTKVSFDSEYGDDKKLRAAELKRPPPRVDPSLGLELFFGFAPVETVLAPPAAITVPNRRGWPAGQAVELFILGLDAKVTYAPYAGWKSVATGTVSSDGKTIATDAGEGIPQLTVVGIRKK